MTTTASAIEVREALKRGANVYAVRRDNLSDRRFPVSKARLRYGRPEVLNRYNRWQGLGGNYVAVIQEQSAPQPEGSAEGFGEKG